MRLRYIETVSFGRSELTNFLEMLQRRPEFARGKSQLGKDDVVVLVSLQGNQLIFVAGFHVIEYAARPGVKKRQVHVLRSTRLRLPGGTRWNPLMLADYAKQVGIELKGLEMYEEYIKKKLAKG